MEKIMRPVWAEIDLDILANNMKNIKKLAGNKEVIAVVKADAYGHGALDVAPCLLENGASRLAVAMLTEAIELRNNNIKAPIMILGYTPLDLGEELINFDIEQTIYDLDYARELSSLAIKLNKKAKVHIAIDTGMGRIGFLPTNESFNSICEIYSLDGLDVVGIFTHFSSSDEADKEYTQYQFNQIYDFIRKLENNGINIPLKHASNSAAIIDLPNTYLDAVRAGIILYGYYPSNEVKKENLSIKPALTLKAKIAHVKELESNMYISYNRTFKTSRKSKIATIPIGYADGYIRTLKHDAKIIVNGQLAPIVGNICMDQFMIDVTDIPNVKTGDEVILLGESNGIKFNADYIAKCMNSINYEVLCLLKKRVPRAYIKSGQIIHVKNNV
ncbi:alanine racemase [uncultured Clostridium sp.]|uniref:alanine racemase n=1 Tax=uncultured Clostridium sp. TaxID=59620 RepID=UPI0025F2B7D3|nr:alanine racemase [uncultured Clostridium sp.]